MKAAVSNIAWERNHDDQVATLLVAHDIRAIEVAPAKINSNPARAARAEIEAYRNFWKRKGISIVAMQSLLYGGPACALFQASAERQAMRAHLVKIFSMAELLGARALVFGSPRQRLRGSLTEEEAFEIATEFFQSLAKEAERYGVVLCIEPNPKRYGCDFINTTEEGLRLVRAVASQNFRLHLDAAAITLSSTEDALTSLAQAQAEIEHFHSSEVDLAPLGTGSVDHIMMAAALRSISYGGYCSVEMKAATSPIEALKNALRVVKTAYQD